MRATRKTKLTYMISLPLIVDEAFLICAEGGSMIPFPIKRFYYINTVTPGSTRGRHAHKKTRQVIFCIQGSVTIQIDNGKDKENIVLDTPNRGVFLDRMVWHEMKNFSSDAMLLVAASEHFQERDYIRNYDQFLTLAVKSP